MLLIPAADLAARVGVESVAFGSRFEAHEVGGPVGRAAVHELVLLLPAFVTEHQRGTAVIAGREGVDDPGVDPVVQALDATPRPVSGCVLRFRTLPPGRWTRPDRESTRTGARRAPRRLRRGGPSTSAGSLPWLTPADARAQAGRRSLGGAGCSTAYGIAFAANQGRSSGSSRAVSPTLPESPGQRSDPHGPSERLVDLG